MYKYRYLAAAIFIAIGVFTLTGCSSELPTIKCGREDFNCDLNAATVRISYIKEEIGYWSNVNFFGQIAIVFFGVVATLVIALQQERFKYWTKTIGIIAATLVTGVSTGLTHFHVPENIDKLIDLHGQLVKATNKYEEDVEQLRAGKSTEEFSKIYSSDKSFREKYNRLVTEFYNKQTGIVDDLLRIKGSAARLNLPPEKPVEPGK